jgi:TPR repeat protein
MKKMPVLMLLLLSMFLLGSKHEFSPELLDRAENNDPQAQLDLGRCYLLGLGVEKNEEEGTRYLKMSADSGDAHALNDYAWCLFKGIGVEKDVRQAVRLFRDAAEKGEAAAQYNLALCSFLGLGMIQDDEEAYLWLVMSAANGLEQAVPQREKLGGIFEPSKRDELIKAAKTNFSNQPLIKADHASLLIAPAAEITIGSGNAATTIEAAKPDSLKYWLPSGGTIWLSPNDRRAKALRLVENQGQ